jgi:hypothetical protein
MSALHRVMTTKSKTLAKWRTALKLWPFPVVAVFFATTCRLTDMRDTRCMFILNELRASALTEGLPMQLIKDIFEHSSLTCRCCGRPFETRRIQGDIRVGPDFRDGDRDRAIAWCPSAGCHYGKRAMVFESGLAIRLSNRAFETLKGHGFALLPDEIVKLVAEK